MEKSVSYNEILDLIVYAEEIVKKVEEYKADDGKVSFSEWIKVFSSTAPEAVKAVVGAMKIGSDKLTADEMTELGTRAFLLIGKIAEIFIK